MFYSGFSALIVFGAACYFCFDIINKMPRDVGRILTEYRDRKWQDFFATLFVTLLFWLITALLLYFVIFPFIISVIGMFSPSTDSSFDKELKALEQQAGMLRGTPTPDIGG